MAGMSGELLPVADPRDWLPAYLVAYRMSPFRAVAARMAGVDMAVVRERMASDATARDMERQAGRDAITILEGQAWLIATAASLHGKPISAGVQSQMCQWLLERWAPQRYNAPEKHDIRIRRPREATPEQLDMLLKGVSPHKVFEATAKVIEVKVPPPPKPISMDDF
jgi:hypothetical protein